MKRLPKTPPVSRRRTPGAELLLLLLTALLAPATLAAQATGPLPGWHVEYRQGERRVATQVPFAAFALRDGQALDPELGPGAATARYRCELVLTERGAARFGLEGAGGRAMLHARSGTGSVTLEWTDGERGGGPLPDKWMTPWLELEPGVLEVEVAAATEAGGERLLRTLWQWRASDGEVFLPEPLSPRQCRVPAALEEGAREGLLRERGRALLESRGCVACHEAPDEASRVLLPGPDLRDVGARRSPAALQQQLRSPRHRMPKVALAAEEEEALMHYLLTLGKRVVPTEEPAPDVVGEGARLYHLSGCVLCHGAAQSPAEAMETEYLSDKVPPAPDARLAIDALVTRDRWTPGTLGAFLLEPTSVHPAGRMPTFDFEREEAAALAAYLWGRAPESEVLERVPDEAHAARGAEVFTARGCGSCHAGLVEGTTRSLPLAELRAGRGCMDEGNAVGYDWAEGEREAVTLALAALQRHGSSESPGARARRMMDELSCLRCHAAAGHGLAGESGGVPTSLDPYLVCLEEETELGDEGRLPPTLHGVGGKLATPWLREVIEGSGRVRTYMGVQMPRFGHAELPALADGLASLVGVAPDSDWEEPALTSADVRAGREMLGRRGMACISCHVVGEHPPAGTAGLDLTEMTGRLRYEWYRRYMQAPARYKPGTRMPAFATSGRNDWKAFYDGDALAQADAMWACMTLGGNMPLPEGVDAQSEASLLVGARPRLFRTFLPEAGSRGIAVGFPSGLHFAFDAETCRLVRAWKGDFVSPSSTWGGRGGGVAGGQGPEVWRAADEPLLVVEGAQLERRFRGYRLDDEGAPTFLYRLSTAEGEALDVAETFVPYPSASGLFERRLRWSGALAGRARITEEDVGWVRVSEEEGVVEWKQEVPR